MPNEIDVVQRRIVQLEIEQAALEKETAGERRRAARGDLPPRSPTCASSWTA